MHEVVDVPLCIDSSTPEALEAAVPLAQGKVLINSVTAEAHSMERLLPLVKRFGAAVIGMANDEEGISMDPGERLAAARKIVEAAADHGIAREDVIIDPLTMPIGAAGDAATAMFETVRLIRDELGVNVSCGASNISFGMPDRQGIDAAFLTMAAMSGMNTAITNPLHQPVRAALLASDLLLGRDQFGSAWIADHRAKTGAERASGGLDGHGGREARGPLRTERHDGSRPAGHDVVQRRALGRHPDRVDLRRPWDVRQVQGPGAGGPRGTNARRLPARVRRTRRRLAPVVPMRDRRGHGRRRPAGDDRARRRPRWAWVASCCSNPTP